MLTESALYERKWGRFPELGRLLSHKQPSVRWTGPSSVSDNIFDQVRRLLEIYALVEDNSRDIEQAVAGAEHPLLRDLIELSQGLSWAAKRFTDAARSMEQLAHHG